MLEFLRSTVPVFEEFLTVLQRSGPTVHVLYDANYALDPFELNEKICSGRSTERCTGSALQSVSCQGIKDRLPDGELVIGDNTGSIWHCWSPTNRKQHSLACVPFFWGGGGGSLITLASQITSWQQGSQGSRMPKPFFKRQFVQHCHQHKI